MRPPKPDASCTVLGLDTGMANLGWAVAVMTPHGLIPAAMGAHRSDSNAKKLNIKSGDDDWGRSVAISKLLHDLVKAHKPRLITCEAISHVRNSAAMAKIGRVFGILADLSVVHDIPVLHATPQEIKIAVAGSKSASKDDIAAALDARFEGVPRQLLARADVDLARDGTVGRREHPYDALGTLVACWDAQAMQMLRQMLGAKP